MPCRAVQARSFARRGGLYPRRRGLESARKATAKRADGLNAEGFYGPGPEGYVDDSELAEAAE